MSGLPSLAPRPPGTKPPAPVRPSPREHSEAEWQGKKELLRRLYVQEDRKLVDIMAMLAYQYDFAASEQMYKKRFKKWRFRKRQYRKSAHNSPASSPARTPETTCTEEPEVEEIVREKPPEKMFVTALQLMSPKDGLPLENILHSVFSWSNGKLDHRPVAMDPMSKYLAGPDQPLIEDSRTMYRTFELVYQLWRHGRGDLAGMAARKAFFSLEYVLMEDHPDLVWHILDTVYDMIDQGHLQLLYLFLQHANELASRRLPAHHPLSMILRQLIRCDYQTDEARQQVRHLLRQAWLRNVEILGQNIGSIAPHQFWLYEQLIWDGRTQLRKNSGLAERREPIIRALENLADHQYLDASNINATKLRIEALELEFTQMDLGNKAEAEQLALKLLQETDSESSKPFDDRFHAYARKMLARIYEDKKDWPKAEENLKLAVVKREAAHGTVNNLRVVRDMWVLAAHYQRAGKPADASRVRQDAIARAEQYLSVEPSVVEIDMTVC